SSPICEPLSGESSRLLTSLPLGLEWIGLLDLRFFRDFPANSSGICWRDGRPEFFGPGIDPRAWIAVGSGEKGRISMRYLTALPVYNEESHIAPVLEKVRRYAQDILVVDDGSKDATPERLAA